MIPWYFTITLGLFSKVSSATGCGTISSISKEFPRSGLGFPKSGTHPFRMIILHSSERNLRLCRHYPHNWTRAANYSKAFKSTTSEYILTHWISKSTGNIQYFRWPFQYLSTMQIEELVRKPNSELLYEWFMNHEPDPKFANLLDKVIDDTRKHLKLG